MIEGLTNVQTGHLELKSRWLDNKHPSQETAGQYERAINPVLDPLCSHKDNNFDDPWSPTSLRLLGPIFTNSHVTTSFATSRFFGPPTNSTTFPYASSRSSFP
ncbi:hypothetical protein C8R42DRAFT_341408 [Lentinula raphanica]|nr:hypothetical protein C8R42DRAFT_341408 [Lentinula raphanica]